LFARLRWFFESESKASPACWIIPLPHNQGASTKEINELHRGRLLDHVQLVVRDLEASRRFYTAVLEVIHVPVAGGGEGWFWADELVITTADSEAAQGVVTGRNHLAFQARDKAMVEAFHRVALEHGGTDNDAPGVRPYHASYYAAFVLDPDGNNIEAVFHGPATRSAASVKVTF
jgi:catechol 2,3-dioxygenase-like lactoylglutathione lyase family enzyme